jgi:hypothetical protein
MTEGLPTPTTPEVIMAAPMFGEERFVAESKKTVIVSSDPAWASMSRETVVVEATPVPERT